MNGVCGRGGCYKVGLNRCCLLGKLSTCLSRSDCVQGDVYLRAWIDVSYFIFLSFYHNSPNYVG